MYTARCQSSGDLQPGVIIRGRVAYTAPKVAYCTLETGAVGWIAIDRCCICRLSHTAQALTPGEAVAAVVQGPAASDGLLPLSRRETLGTWAENAAHFRQGQQTTGTVRSIQPYGIFVELLPNLAGLAESTPGVRVGDTVVVTIRAILPQKHKIKLDIRQVLPQPGPRMPTQYYITSGHICRWEYYPGSPAITVF